MIATDHVLLLQFEDNEDIVFADNGWNHVEVSYADHTTNNEDSIREVAKFSGIHVLYEQTCGPRDVQFHPPQTLISVNFDSNSMERPRQRVKIVTERPQKNQAMVLSSSILTLTQPPPADAEKGLARQPILLPMSPLEDVVGETSKSVREDGEVYDITIQNGIERCHENDAVQLESVSSSELHSEESPFNTRGSDSDVPFNRVGRKHFISGLEAISPGAKSDESSSNTKGSHSDYVINLVDRKSSVNGHVTLPSRADSLGSIKEAINALELLMVKDLSEVSSDPATQFGLHQLLDVLSRRTVEVQEALAEFKRKAVTSCQEFQSTVESVNKLKSNEKHLERIQQETITSKDRRNDLKNSIKEISLVIKAENKRKKELEAEIDSLKEQLDAKGRDLEQLLLNLKNKEATLSAYSTNCASLNDQAQKLLEEADVLLAAKDEGEAAEVKQNRLKSTWSSDITLQISKIKHNIFGSVHNEC